MISRYPEYSSRSSGATYGVCASDITTIASFPGFAARYHCATSIDLSKTEQPWACMLTVRSDRESSPCVLPMISDARQGSIWSGVFVAATRRPMRVGSPPHSLMQRVVAFTLSCVVELVGFLGLP